MKDTYSTLKFTQKPNRASLWLLTIFFFSTFKLEAQDFVWAKATPIPPKIIIKSLITDTLHNSYIFGNANIYFNTYADTSGSFLSKMDENGNILFSKQWKTSFYLNDIKYYKDYLYATGCFSGNISIDGIPLQSQGSWDGFVAKINLNGTFQWIKAFGTSGEDVSNGLTINKLDETVLITGGYRISHIAGVDSSQIFIRSYLTDGNLNGLKDFTYFTQYKYGNFGKEIVTDSLGFIYLLAHRAGNHPLDGPYPKPGSCILKLDSNLDSIWCHNFTRDCEYSEEVIVRMKLNPNNNLTVVSFCKDFYAGHGNLLQIANVTGHETWTYTNSSNFTGYMDVVVDNNNSYILGGNEYSIISAGDNDTYGFDVFKKIDQNKNIIWEKKFSYNSGIHFINNDYKNLYVYGGLGADTISTQNGTVSNLGTFIAKVNDNSINTAIGESFSVSSFNIYPNPSLNIFNVFFSKLDSKENIHLVIRNILGQTILEKQVPASDINESGLSINLSKHPKGIYFVEVKYGNVTDTKRIVLQ